MMPALANPVFKDLNPYAAQFARFEEREAGKWPAWLQTVRRSGLDRAMSLGLPTTDQEDWRFTSVRPIAELPFKPALSTSRHGVTPAMVKRFLPEPAPPHVLVFIDGHYSAELSAVGPKPDGVQIGSLASAITLHADKLERYWIREGRTLDQAFAALNAAFFQDGAFIWVPPGVELQEPICLVFLASGHDQGLTIHPRNLVIAQKRSQVRLMECYAGLGSNVNFTNSVTELVINDEALVEHCKIQQENLAAFHIASLNARLDRGSQYQSHSISLGARVSRDNLQVVMNDEGGVCLLNGLYLARQNQLVDHHTSVDHARPHCESHEFYHGILSDQARGVFNGKIIVRLGAQKTNAKQTNRNLLLTEGATIDTKPQLEIFADDVKCTHGATVGQLDEDMLFYLRARGLDIHEARAMLIHAFAGEILDRISVPAVRCLADGWVSECLRPLTLALDAH
jgi:Fe-S cluster assembly protein SufD